MRKQDRTIVIFDDDEDILSICKFILEERGWKVIGFTDCKNVLEKVSATAPDIIMMDNRIPEEGGIHATRQLKADPDLKQIPVIYFSATNAIDKLAAEAGAQAYLAKPFELAALEKIIEQTLITSEL